MFSEARIKVVVISFGSKKGAETWLKETSCQLEMYLDSERVVYNHLGLSRSLSKVWNIGSVRYYAGKKSQGKPLPSIHKEDDPLQMGGDFTFRCSNKKLVMSHPSKTPIDRPPISEILSVVKA